MAGSRRPQWASAELIPPSNYSWDGHIFLFSWDLSPHVFLGEDLEVDWGLCSKAERPGADRRTQGLQQGTSHPAWQDWKGELGAAASEHVWATRTEGIY